MAFHAAPVCPVHGVKAVLVPASVVYGRDIKGARSVWICQDTNCDARVGCHDDGRPLGTMAGAELRRWRERAHAAFDPLWKGGTRQARGAMYRRLAEALGLERAHIGEFTVEQCQKAIRWSEQRHEAAAGEDR